MRISIYLISFCLAGLLSCKGQTPNTQREKSVDTISCDEKLSICELPIDFDDYYSTCIYPGDTKKCQERYPKYSLESENNMSQLLKQNKYELPEEYILLPLVNKIIQPVILCYTGSDIEQYILITIQDNKIISKLEIGEIKDNESKLFYIDIDYKIAIYKGDRKNIWKIYKMTDNGNFLLL